MRREYKIKCATPTGSDLADLLHTLPSPISKMKFVEIYNYRIDADGYYLIDHGVDRAVAAQALQVFIDSALSSSDCISIQAP